MPEGSWEISHVLFAKADNATGAITYQLGDVKSNEVYDVEAPVFQIPGALCLPANPVAGQSAAEAVTLTHPAGNVVVACRSVRSAAIAGLIKMGESSFFADGSQACSLYKLDGSLTHFTTHDNTANGRSVYYRISPERGFDEAWPWGRRFFDKSGHHFVHVSGAQFHLGSVNAPAPLNTFSTTFSLTAAMGRLNASFVSVGPDNAVFSPVARADAVIAALDAASSALTTVTASLVAINAALVALGAIPVNSAAESLCAAVAAPVTAAGLAISAAASVIAGGAVGTVPVPGPIGSQCLSTA
jgi:hypothetical protein